MKKKKRSDLHDKQCPEQVAISSGSSVVSKKRKTIQKFDSSKATVTADPAVSSHGKECHIYTSNVHCAKNKCHSSKSKRHSSSSKSHSHESHSSKSKRHSSSSRRHSHESHSSKSKRHSSSSKRHSHEKTDLLNTESASNVNAHSSSQEEKQKHTTVSIARHEDRSNYINHLNSLTDQSPRKMDRKCRKRVGTLSGAQQDTCNPSQEEKQKPITTSVAHCEGRSIYVNHLGSFTDQSPGEKYGFHRKHRKEISTSNCAQQDTCNHNYRQKCSTDRMSENNCGNFKWFKDRVLARAGHSNYGKAGGYSTKDGKTQEDVCVRDSNCFTSESAEKSLNVLKLVTEGNNQATKDGANISSKGAFVVDQLEEMTAPNKSILQTSKKLLVLDINGILADILIVPNADQVLLEREHINVSMKTAFKRPFCDDFLNFCFNAFDVGIWSSRMKHNVEVMVNYLFGNMKKKLLFCWDSAKCTHTGFDVIGNRGKPLVLKELRKLWDKEEPDLPWEKGRYSPSNTLLIDDSPSKALCNPPCTGIFPRPYRYTDEKDNSLGLGGDIRFFLEGLAKADDVQDYVEKNPFGQNSITDRDPSWKFYLQVIHRVEKRKKIKV